MRFVRKRVIYQRKLWVLLCFHIFYSGDEGISKNHCDHSSLKTGSFRGLTHDIMLNDVLNRVHKHYYFSSSFVFRVPSHWQVEYWVVTVWIVHLSQVFGTHLTCPFFSLHTHTLVTREAPVFHRLRLCSFISLDHYHNLSNGEAI